MESWLVDVKQLRIPRPKFGGSSPPRANSSSAFSPREPPRDYNLNDDVQNAQTSMCRKFTNLQNTTATDTEEIRQALQEKL